MKNYILIGILLDLLNHDRITAKDLAAKYELSTRSIYRYVDTLTAANVPIITQAGSGGGISIMDDYKLDKMFFTPQEYTIIFDAMSSMSRNIPSDDYTMALNKLRTLKYSRSEQERYMLESDSLVIDGGPWGDSNAYRHKLITINKALVNQTQITITYINNSYQKTIRLIEPHTIVLKEGVWYVYAYCHSREDFRLFKVTRIVHTSLSEVIFERRRIDLTNPPWSQGFTAPSDPVKLEFQYNEKAQADIEEWLGVDALCSNNLARATLPLTPMLIRKLLSFGADIKVISPLTVITALQSELLLTRQQYPD